MKVKFIEEEIDIRIESIKDQLEIAREKLKNELYKIKAELKKYIILFKDNFKYFWRLKLLSDINLNKLNDDYFNKYDLIVKDLQNNIEK